MNPASRERQAERLIWLLFAVGLGLSLVMAVRSQVGGDQLRYLVLGWTYYKEGTVLPFGSGMSRGGLIPGSISSLLVGLPLHLWDDYRSASFVTVGFHVVSFLLLDSVLRGTVGTRERVLFGVLYWLNPWRVYHSAHVWNPNWIFLFGSFHLWTAFRMRHDRSFVLSFLHVFAIGIAFQVHGSFLILVVTSALMFWRRYLHVSWPGVLAACAVTMLTLIPWLIEVTEHPEILPMHGGFLGRGFVLVYPLVKGLTHLFRYASLSCSGTMTQYDFTPDLGETADRILAPLMTGVTAIASATVVIAVVAHVWFWRRGGRAGFGRLAEDATPHTWLLGYVRWGLLGAAITFGLSPTTVMSYQAFIVFHVALMPLVLWVASWAWTERRAWRRYGVPAYCGLLAVVLLAQMMASPVYRTGGRHGVNLVVRQWHPALDDLRVTDRAEVRVHPQGISTNPYDHAISRDDGPRIGG